MNPSVSHTYVNGYRPVLIHPGYGGFSLSLNSYLLEEFNKIFGPDNFDSYNPEPSVRTHPKVISLFEELFNQSNRKFYNDLSFVYIPEEYVIYDAFRIVEYDGAERVELNTHKLAIELIRKITNDMTKSQSNKMLEITEILRMI
jgi:hypothetical protein